MCKRNKQAIELNLQPPFLDKCAGLQPLRVLGNVRAVTKYLYLKKLESSPGETILSLENVMKILKEIQDEQARNSSRIQEIYNKIFSVDPYQDTDDYLASYPS